jgi:hypothetical protein
MTAKEFQQQYGKSNHPEKPERSKKKKAKDMLTVYEATEQVILMLDLNEEQRKKAMCVINQLKLNGRI